MRFPEERTPSMQHLRLRSLAPAILLCASSFAAPSSDTNCFAAFLTDTPPRIVETLSKQVSDGVEVTRLRFLSRVVPGSGRQVIIYAVLARPTAPGPHPGLLMCHGGGGYADGVASQTIGWAKRGYVAICQDQPGFCRRSKSLSSGPCMETGASSFKIETGPTDSALFDGIAAALNSLALLRSQPDVDKARVGVWGGSWGGYMATMVTGLAGNRVKAAYSVYGCGYYDVGSTWIHRIQLLGPEGSKIWLDNLDAGRRAHNLTASYFVPSPANDWFFWPSAVMRTLADMPGEKNYCFMPNDSHALRQPGGSHGPPKVNYRLNRTYMEILWLNYHLKGEGKPFPRATATGAPQREGNAVRVELRVNGPVPVKKATVWFAAGELPWRFKWWRPSDTEHRGNGQYTGLVPIEEPAQPVHWFAVVTDERNVSVSTLIRTVDPKTLGFEAEGYAIVQFHQDFEDRAEHRRWRRRYMDVRQKGAHGIRTTAAHTGKYGLELGPGKRRFCCWGLRAAALERGGVTKLRLHVRAAKESCPLPGVELVAELPNSLRCAWRWASPPTDPIGTDWQTIEIPFSELQFTGKGRPPMPMLSPALGQLRFVPTEETHVYIDDVEAL